MAENKPQAPPAPDTRPQAGVHASNRREAAALSESYYIAALEDIRAITQCRNPEHRMMTWREAVEVWEQKHGRDERARAAFFIHIGIATTGECMLLDDMEDAT